MAFSARLYRHLGVGLLTCAALTAAAHGAAAERGSSAPREAPVTPAFVRNTGQADPRARFVALAGAQPIFITDADVRLVAPGRQRALWLTFVGGAAQSIEGGSHTDSVVRFVSGSSARTQTAYGDVVYRRMWPGIDARITGVRGGIEYSFELGAAADPGAIRLRYRGADHTTLNAAGELVLDLGGQTVVDRGPIAYQRVAGRTVPVMVRFVQHGDDIAFELGAYDRTQPLVIDPTIVYSTYLGGSGHDEGRAIAVDATGAAYVVGLTRYSDFPTTPGAYQPLFRGGTGTTPSDAFVAKINSAGTQFDYVTYLGGSGNDEATGIAVDGSGNAYITGDTESADFPVTAGAYRTSIGVSHHDGFVTKLNASGSALVYSTFLGSNAPTDPAAIAVDAQGLASITGTTLATNLPSTTNFATFNTSSGRRDAFLLKLNAAGSSVAFAMPFGGVDEDYGIGLAVDGTGYAYVVGRTSSTFLRTTPNAVQRDPNTAALKSADVGATWAATARSTRSKQINAFAIDPQNASIVYAGSDANILRSTDGGASWAIVNNGDFTSGADVFDIAINPATPTTVLIATATGVYRSTNSGGSWSFVWGTAGSPITRIAYAPSNPSVIYGLDGGGLRKSTDGLTSWPRVLSALGSSFAVDPTNANIVYFGTADGTMMKTTNGGSTWSAVALPLSGSPVTAVAVDPAAPSTIVAGQTNTSLVRSTDGGASWTAVGFNGSGAPNRLVFDPIDDAAYDAELSGLMKSTDHGATWQFLSMGGNSVLPILTIAARAGTVFAGTIAQTDGFVYKVNTNAGTDDPVAYGTYLGGIGSDAPVGLAIDAKGAAYIAMNTSSADIADTTHQPRAASVVIKLNADASGITYSSFIGPTPFYQAAQGIAVDGAQHAYVVGGYDDENSQVWIEHLDASGFTADRMFLDGRRSYTNPTDWGRAVAVDKQGSAYVTGYTTTTDYPTTPGAPQPSYGSGERDAIISKVAFAAPPPPPPAGANVALGKTVVVSSIEAAQYAGANAADGSMSTRWSSAFSDPQWIQVDLGQPYAISEVVLRWEAAFGADYAVQVSSDASAWTTIRAVTGADGGVDDLTGLSGTGRYVRVLGSRRGTPWGYSLWEFEVYGTPATRPPSTINRALGRQAVASSVESPSLAAANAVDGSQSTRWSSQFSDSQWIYVDLVDRISVNEVRLTWETAFAADYQIEISDDVTNWTSIRSVTNNTQTVNDLAVVGTGRYLRIRGTRRATQWGYSLWELEVYGTLDSTPPPPPPPPVNTNIVIYANDVPAAARHGSWTVASDTTAAAGTKLVTPDNGVANTNAPLANPTDWVDATFNASAGTAYTVWLRMRATANSKLNDAVWVQFSDAIANGSAAYAIGSPSGLLVNLATDSTGGSLSGWGWQNTAYWLAQATRVTFATSGAHTIRIQVREDGVQFDQIVLSPTQYATSQPGPVTNDSTIVPKP